MLGSSQKVISEPSHCRLQKPVFSFLLLSPSAPREGCSLHHKGGSGSGKLIPETSHPTLPTWRGKKEQKLREVPLDDGPHPVNPAEARGARCARGYPKNQKEKKEMPKVTGHTARTSHQEPQLTNMLSLTSPCCLVLIFRLNTNSSFP